MVKRKRILHVAKTIKKGRGKVEGDKYIPGIKINDIFPLGRLSRISAINTKGQNELLANMERNYLYFLGYLNKVEGIGKIKSEDAFLNKVILEKFEIERLYWDRKGISFV